MEKENIVKNEGIKLCSKCGVNPREEGQWYCSECRKEYNKSYYDSNKANILYKIMPKYPLYEGENLYYGSTENWSHRISCHRKNKTKGMNKINEVKREGVVYRAILDSNLTRDELYFIEYYLIHQYQLKYGYLPIGNTNDRRELDIEPKRELELIRMSDKLEYEYIEDLNNKKYF